jgi:hypothetical protein
MARRKGSEPVSLRALVPSVYPSKEPDDVRATRLFFAWEKAVPPQVYRNARPVAFVKGTLVVHAATTVWAQEIDLLKDQLLTSLRRNVPHSGVRKLLVRVGKLPPLPVKPRDLPPHPPSVPLSELPEELARELSRVSDDDVRTAISDAAAATLGRDRVAKRGRRD